MRGSLSEEAEQILRTAEKSLLVSSFDPSQPPVVGRGEIERVLPHRDPFLFIDAVLCLDLERGLIATRYDLQRGHAILAGHYPNNPLWPAIFQVEAIAQAGGFFYNCSHHVEGAPGLLTHILGARFMRPVTPGADVHVVARVLEDGLFIEIVGQSLQNGQICSVAAVKFYSLGEDL